MSTYAYIFASGYGSRLKPYTNRTPKPLLKWTKEELSMLDLNIQQLLKYNIHDIYISHSRERKQYEKIILKYQNKANIQLIYEKSPVGQGKSLQNQLLDFRDEDIIIGLNGDTYTKQNLHRMISTFIKDKEISCRIYSSQKSKNPVLPIICDSKDIIYGKIGSQETLLYKKRKVQDSYYFNHIGTFLLKAKVLSVLDSDPFIGIFGNNDLIDQMINASLLCDCKILEIQKRFTFNTPEEYLNIKGKDINV